MVFAYMTATIDNLLVTSNTSDLDIAAIYNNIAYNTTNESQLKDISNSIIEAVAAAAQSRRGSDAAHSLSSLKKILKPPGRILAAIQSLSS